MSIDRTLASGGHGREKGLGGLYRYDTMPESLLLLPVGERACTIAEGYLLDQ
jgi:hypothetical protein